MSQHKLIGEAQTVLRKFFSLSLPSWLETDFAKKVSVAKIFLTIATLVHLNITFYIATIFALLQQWIDLVLIDFKKICRNITFLCRDIKLKRVTLG